MVWSKIVGHQRQIDGFRHLAAQQRLAHAYLFVGPVGIGKRLFATELTKALLCEAPGHRRADLQACDQCEACLLVDAGTHPDLFVVARPEEKNEFPIDLMKDFCRAFCFKSARGKGKVGIVEDADDFNEESANCFLKTLEEPPPGSMLILLSASSDRQLPTIKSRCQIVRFAPLPDEQVTQLLRAQGVEEETVRERLVRLAGGSPGQALALADEELWQCRRRLLQALSKPKGTTKDVMEDLVKFVESAGKELALQRRRALLVLRLLIESFADVMRLQVGAAPRSAEATDLPYLELLAQRAEPDKILALLERSMETDLHVNRYIKLSLVLEALFDALGQLLDQTGPVPLRYQGFPA